MAQDPACAMSPYGKNLTEGIVSQKDGATTAKLSNVYVYVKDGLGNKVFAAPMEPAVLDQKGCRYVPHVLAAMVGQPIEFRNSDPTMHNVHMQPTVGGNQQFDISQPPNGHTTRNAFAKPELMIPVRCNNHPWMQAFLNVAPNPFFAVSGEDVPAGAWDSRSAVQFHQHVAAAVGQRIAVCHPKTRRRLPGRLRLAAPEPKQERLCAPGYQHEDEALRYRQYVGVEPVIRRHHRSVPVSADVGPGIHVDHGPRRLIRREQDQGLAHGVVLDGAGDRLPDPAKRRPGGYNCDAGPTSNAQ